MLRSLSKLEDYLGEIINNLAVVDDPCVGCSDSLQWTTLKSDIGWKGCVKGRLQMVMFVQEASNWIEAVSIGIRCIGCGCRGYKIVTQ
ncbi:hypothetical protein HPP92_022129 [Vanilla planifolia]|uniref:Uncharacterized protein n=1 Tax=Vanilla planifolia TaxID=51239 RepID=A0A835PVV7_VANPL|nr:hypothetical protein HPP92_022129 [Vanilla planifolia]